MQTRLEDSVSLPPPGTPEGSSSERGQSPGASASGPFLLGLAAGLCGRRRICHHEGSLLPVCHAVHGVRFLCDFFHYPRFLLIPWLPVIKVS